MIKMIIKDQKTKEFLIYGWGKKETLRKEMKKLIEEIKTENKKNEYKRL